jgi:hypothetical protein
MHLARIQDNEQERNVLEMPEKALTSLQAVTETLEGTRHSLCAESFVEGLFRRGYAVISIDVLQPNVIFKGRQA